MTHAERKVGMRMGMGVNVLEAKEEKKNRDKYARKRKTKY